MLTLKLGWTSFTKEHVGRWLGCKPAESNREEEDMELRDEMPDLQFKDLPVTIIIFSCQVSGQSLRTAQ